jgi:superfamily II DNA or RNA helicase
VCEYEFPKRTPTRTVSAVNQGRSPLVLTERIEHLQILAQLLSPKISRLIQLRGGQTRRELDSALAGLADNADSVSRVVLATGKYIGEGFDDPGLDTLFLALPMSWRGTVAQYVGRLHRLHAGKREVRVYDYSDLNVPMLENAEGEARARSASEAFLFRRLQTLPATAGRFRLNVELPISFDSAGKMEVDLLCAEIRLVVELDGAQHLCDPEAYWRDRRKDALLQQKRIFRLTVPGRRCWQTPGPRSGYDSVRPGSS